MTFPTPTRSAPLLSALWLPPRSLLIVVVVLVVVVVGWVIWSYNRFVAQLASIDATWANIATELQRRHELVPNLVATAQGYATHERELFDAVADARARAVAATADDVGAQARAEDDLTDRLTGLLAIAEDHPDLKANTLFLDLQRQLVETEDRLLAARRLYNLEVAAYERRRRSVPSNLLAGHGPITPRHPFEIRDAAAAHAPVVFGTDER